MAISRRNFVAGGLISAAALTQRGCGNDVKAAPIVDVTVDDDGQIRVPVPMYPDLAVVGGAVTLRLAPLPAGDRPFVVPPHGLLLIHRAAAGDDPQYVATRSDCPHQGCPLGYNAGSGLIECPCHASRFLAVTDKSDATQCAGKVVHLPAQSDLGVFKVTVTGDYVYVDLRTDLSCGAQTGIPGVVNGTITIPVADFPALGTVGGSLVYAPSNLGDKIIVSRISPTEVITLSSICTHRQCDVSLDLANKSFDCPCHGGVYNFEGVAIAGPPKDLNTGPLKKKYPTTLANDVIVITVS